MSQNMPSDAERLRGTEAPSEAGTVSPEERAVEDALRAAINADDEGAILTNWLCISVSTVPGDTDATAYTYSGPDGLEVHAALGLAEMARHHFIKQAQDPDA